MWIMARGTASIPGPYRRAMVMLIFILGLSYYSMHESYLASFLDGAVPVMVDGTPTDSTAANMISRSAPPPPPPAKKITTASSGDVPLLVRKRVRQQTRIPPPPPAAASSSADTSDGGYPIAGGDNADDTRGEVPIDASPATPAPEKEHDESQGLNVTIAKRTKLVLRDPLPLLRLDMQDAHRRRRDLSYERIVFPIVRYCPMVVDGNATFVKRIPDWYHDNTPSHRATTTPPPFTGAASSCFGELLGTDYNPGRENDMAEIRGATLEQCLTICRHRNLLIDERSQRNQESSNVTHLPKEEEEEVKKERNQTLSGDEQTSDLVTPLSYKNNETTGQNVTHTEEDHRIQQQRCAAVVYHSYGKICWLKRRGTPEKRLTDVNTYVLDMAHIELRRPLPIPKSQSKGGGGGGDDDDFQNSSQTTTAATAQQHNRSIDNALANGEDEANNGSRRSLTNVLAITPATTPYVASFNNLTSVQLLRRRINRPQSRFRSELSTLYGILTEHQYIKSRMIPALSTWLKEEHVMVLLVRNTIEERRLSEALLAPYLGYRATPETVRVTEYLIRDSLKDLARLNPTAQHEPIMQQQRQQKTEAMQETLLKRTRLRFSKKSDTRLKQLLDKYNMHRQWDQGEYRLVKDSGAWKDLPGLLAMFKRFHNYSFYMMIDDDSYIIQRNFEILLSSAYSPKWDPWVTPIYAGVASVWYQPISELRGTITHFIQGGAGILMSHAAVAKVYPQILRCRFACDYLPHGDVRLGCCMRKLANIDMFFEPSFWHMHIYRAQARDARQNHSTFPVSFHRMKNASMMFPLHECVEEEENRMHLAGVSRAVPVSWNAVIACYRWMRGTQEHEYKFQMNELH